MTQIMKVLKLTLTNALAINFPKCNEHNGELQLVEAYLLNLSTLDISRIHYKIYYRGQKNWN